MSADLRCILIMSNDQQSAFHHILVSALDAHKSSHLHLFPGKIIRHFFLLPQTAFQDKYPHF